MRLTPEQRAFFAALDETPRTPHGLLLRDGQGEIRTFPISALGRREVRSAQRPRLERARNLNRLLAHIIEKDER